MLDILESDRSIRSGQGQNEFQNGPLVFLLIFIFIMFFSFDPITFIWKSESCLVVSNSLWPHGLLRPRVGSLSLLQGIFPTQGSNPGLLHCRQILYQLSHKGSPRIPEWVAYPFCRRSSWPRDRTGVSCIAGGFFTNWAIREALHVEMF